MDDKIPVLLNSYTRIVVALFMSIFLLAVFKAFNPPLWVFYSFAFMFSFLMITLVLRLRLYRQLLKCYRTSLPMDMLLHINKISSDEMEAWYAELRKPEAPADDIEFSFDIVKTPWVVELSESEQVKVYGEFSLHGFLIETRFGLLWPGSIKYFPKYYRKR